MAKKSTTDTCCLTLPLVLEKWQTDRLEKRFEIARQIYNTLVNYELKKLDKLKQTDEYKAVIDALQALEEQKDPGKEKKALFRQLDTLRQNAGFSEYGFKSDIQPFYKHFKDNIGSSVAVHGIAHRTFHFVCLSQEIPRNIVANSPTKFFKIHWIKRQPMFLAWDNNVFNIPF